MGETKRDFKRSEAKFLLIIPTVIEPPVSELEIYAPDSSTPGVSDSSTP